MLGQQNSGVDGHAVLSVDLDQGGHPSACQGIDLEVSTGWDLIQRDWGLRQREPGCDQSGLAHRLMMRIEAALIRVRLLVGRVLRCPAEVAHARSMGQGE